MIWVSFNPLIILREINPGTKSTQALSLIARLLFAFLLCSAALLFEKLSIQWIAWKFHERSYAGTVSFSTCQGRRSHFFYKKKSVLPTRNMQCMRLQHYIDIQSAFQDDHMPRMWMTRKESYMEIPSISFGIFD